MVSDRELQQVMPTLSARQRASYLPFLQAAMSEREITTRLREAAFLAQVAHESGEGKYTEELASGAAYEGRRDLGNTQPGDGVRFKGRGWIQVTGRANYRRYGEMLGLPLLEQPELAARPDVGARVAAAFWATHGLNELADAKQFRAITRRINGGLNHYDRRQAYYRRALAALNEDPAVPEAADDVAVTLNGQPVDCAAYLDDGRSWGALRPVCAALGWNILETELPDATVQVSNGGVFTLPLRIQGSRGFSPLGRLALGGVGVQWDKAARQVALISR